MANSVFFIIIIFWANIANYPNEATANLQKPRTIFATKTKHP